MVLLIMSARPRLIILVLTALVAATAALAQDGSAAVVDASVHGRDGWLHADVRLRDVLDARTASTVDSGLSGVCAYEVRVIDPDGREVAWQAWALHLEHDLWEDRYLVRGREGEWTLPSLAAMDSLCSTIEDLRLVPLSRLDIDVEYRLTVKVEVQPLAAEDRDRLSRYVSRRDNRNREELDFDLGNLFGSLFTGGGGRRTSLAYTGSAFRPRALEHRP